MIASSLARNAKTVFIAGALVTMAATAIPPTASAQSHLKVGVLTCATGPSIGLIIASTEKASCSFHPDVGSPEHYTGHIRKFGLDIGITAGSVIIWAVFSPQSGYAPGSLAGIYAGASAEATVVVGLGANVLVGGSNKQFALQPLSLQAQTGVNLAIGVTELDLTKR
jgi:hypothetical protein